LLDNKKGTSKYIAFKLDKIELNSLKSLLKDLIKVFTLKKDSIFLPIIPS